MTNKVRFVSSGFALTSFWTWAAFSVAFGSMQVGTGMYQGTQFLAQDLKPSAFTTSAEIDTTWRHTKHGWQDSARWPVETFVSRKTIELLHPFTWAAIVLISVVATTIWASSEWEIARLFTDDAEEKAVTDD